MMAIQKRISTHHVAGARRTRLVTKAPKYFTSQMQLSAPQERSPLTVLRGKTPEAERQQAITRLGSIDGGFLSWWEGRERTHPRVTADPEQPSPFVAYWTTGIGGRMVESHKQLTKDEEWKTWATQKEPEWLERLASLAGLSSVS
jgi:hypothetical protein